MDDELSQQCTACGFRFDCASYKTYLGGKTQDPDLDILNIFKNRTCSIAGKRTVRRSVSDLNVANLWPCRFLFWLSRLGSLPFSRGPIPNERLILNQQMI